MTSTTPIENNALNQADYLKLFMQELTYQDPLQPVDNKEFMAQMAQFSALQTQQTMNANIEKLLSMHTADQALNLLNKTVHIKNTQDTGIVKKIVFNENQSPTLSVEINGNYLDINLNDIEEVQAHE